jgi:hypothetical protein
VSYLTSVEILFLYGYLTRPFAAGKSLILRE